MSFVSRTPTKEVPSKLVKIDYPSTKLGAVTRKSNEIKDLLVFRTKEYRDRVTQLFKEYMDKIGIYDEACNEVMNNIDPQIVSLEQIETFKMWRNENRCKMDLFQEQVVQWLNEIDTENDVDPVDSVSNVSSRDSRGSKSSSLRQKIAEERARYQAEREFHERKKLLEEQMKTRKAEEERHRIEEETIRIEQEQLLRQLELEKSERFVKNLEHELDAIDNAGSTCETQSRKTTVNNVHKYNQNDQHLNNIRAKNELKKDTTDHEFQLADVLAKQNDLNQMLIRNQEYVLLPTNEPEFFNGTDLTKFKPFIMAFESMIEKRCHDDQDRLYYLEKYTSGEPLQLVRSCCQSGDPTHAYQSAKQLLYEEYGNDYLVASEYLNKLENWKPMIKEDGKALRELSMYLISCASVMNGMSSLNQLNSPNEITKIMHKLPIRLQHRWREESYRLRKNNGDVSFQDFVKFVREQSSIINQPLFGNIGYNKEERKNTKFEGTFIKKKSFAINAENSQKDENFKKPNTSFKAESRGCVVCKKDNHDILTCKFFQKRNHADKIKFIKEKNLCFGCLKSSNHTSKGCLRRETCQKCKRRHPTIIHYDFQNATKEESKRTNDSNGNNITNVGTTCEEPTAAEPTVNYATKPVPISAHTGAGEKIFHPAVPVKIKVKGSHKMIETYAGLDPYSSAVFMNEALLQQLEVKCATINLSITTMERTKGSILTQVLNNLEIYDLDENESDLISVVYCKRDWPFAENDAPKPDDLRDLKYLNNIPFRYINAEIGLLIGINKSEILKPIKSVHGPRNMPYATFHKFGWTLNGYINSINPNIPTCYKIKVESTINMDEKFEKLCSQEFKDEYSELKGKSMEDVLWEKRINESIRHKDGYYEVCLPFRDDTPTFPFNKCQALGALKSLKFRLQKNETFYKEYNTFVNSMLQNGYAEQVPFNELKTEPGKVWYLTHHGVYHKQKKKLRVVFNASLKYKGISLNDALIPGPDLTSNLMGVLLRFRQDKIAFVGDIAKMFYQVRVIPQHTNYLRFFWFPEANLEMEPIEYRVKVHIFGATSSPSVANFVLKYCTATEGAEKYSVEAIETIRKNFYVDDLLKSVESESIAISLLNEIRNILSTNGFHLTGFISNSRRVLESLQKEDLASEFQILDLLFDDLPFERALGLQWNVENDAIGIRLNIPEQPKTKRGILSTVFSIYDPLGLVAPAILPAKKIFQEICNNNLSWDEKIPTYLNESWDKWLEKIFLLKHYEVARCCKPDFPYKKCDVHYFCDGSQTAFAAVAYLHFEDNEGRVHCTLALAKSRLVPLNRSTLATIPRIELNAAKLAINLQQTLKRELKINIDSEYFWTDSLTVLNYIKCETKRFQRFVSNRVAFIRANSDVKDWNQVPGKLNPADLASRGCFANELLRADFWKKGPKFLWETKENWPKLQMEKLNENDPEIIKEKRILSSKVQKKTETEKLIQYSSSWLKTKINVAWMLRLRKLLLKKNYNKGALSVQEIEEAEKAIWRFVQRKEYKESLFHLEKNGKLIHKDKMTKLHPFLDQDGILRVGGRISSSEASYNVRHPIILPRENHAVTLLIRNEHSKLGHLGRQTLLSSLRQRYWIIGGNSAIRKVIKDCLSCRKRNEKPSKQLMGELPKERLQSDLPPFTNIGIDAFGPFLVVRGRGLVREKRYGLIFSCLSSRATHIEIIHSLDTSSFINAFRRFQSRRGRVKVIRSDNGTNFVGSNRELQEATKEWNNTHTEKWLQQENIEWKFQPPSASHFGGHFERQIRTIRKILNALMNEQPIRFNDENLNTLMCEVECILNSRPLTEISDDPNDFEALTPNHILNLKSEITFPPGIFRKEDVYLKKRWKQVQYLSELFWKRWRKEYLPLLQERQKWLIERRSHQEGDLVLLVDQLLPRNQWSLGRIVKTFPDKDDIVRVIDVKVAKTKGQNGMTIVRRPITKIISLKSVDEL